MGWEIFWLMKVNIVHLMVVAVGAVLVFRGICGVFSGGGLFRVPDEQSVEHDHQFHESGIFRNVMGEALRRGDFVDIIEKSLLLFLI